MKLRSNNLKKSLLVMACSLSLIAPFPASATTPQAPPGSLAYQICDFQPERNLCDDQVYDHYKNLKKMCEANCLTLTRMPMVLHACQQDCARDYDYWSVQAQGQIDGCEDYWFEFELACLALARSLDLSLQPSTTTSTSMPMTGTMTTTMPSGMQMSSQGTTP